VLIALRRGCRQCVMVGDQQQLTATVFSPQARAARYDRSLFQRLVEIGHPYIMLDTQYRMAPDISAFPCRTFYKGQLKNGENVLQPAYLAPFLRSAGAGERLRSVRGRIFSSFMFLDLQSSCERQGSSGSQSNAEEAMLCFALIRALQQAGRQAGCRTIGSVGVITFYSDQVLELNRVMRTKAFNPDGGECAVQDFEVNTVDGFQGKEKDIIIISAVRANDRGSVGFTSDLRRLNVGLTRARKGLFVIGHAPTLRSDVTWRSLLDHASATGSLVSVPDSECDLACVLSSNSNSIRNDAPPQGPEQSAFAPRQPPPPPLAAAQRPQEAAPVADATSGRIVVSSGAVGWVSEPSNNPEGSHEAPSAPQARRCGDRDYGLIDRLASVTHAIHKRKLQEISPEEGELEE
jgi:superfamily I DNA and/or RNA helicase